MRALTKKRDLIHIEFLRVIATYMVLFNHTGIYGFFLYSVEQHSPFYPVYLFMSIACKPAVPLFYMISGALLLGKTESMKEIYRKRVFKYILVLIVISIIYHIYDWQFMGTELDWKTCFLTIYSSSASPALWYLYTYIGILMMLPLLRRLVQGMKQQDYLYMMFCHLMIAGVIPIVQYLASKGTVWLSVDLYTPLFTVNSIFYLIMGYFFENVLDEKAYCRKNCIIAAGTGFLSIVIMCLMTQYEVQLTGVCNEGSSQTFYGCLLAWPVFAIYFSAKTFFLHVHVSSFIRNMIKFLGSTTFGIYLLERILRDRTSVLLFRLQPVIHTMPACLIWILSAYLYGTAVTAILKKIPVIKNYL